MLPSARPSSTSSGLIDDDPALHGKAVLRVLGGIDLLEKDALSDAAIIVAIKLDAKGTIFFRQVRC